jgi:hypothetical protein
MGAPEHQAGYRADYVAEPTIGSFHNSNAFVRGIRGPYGSGKSVGCVIEIVRRAMEQAPDRFRRRKTRFAAIRNTYGELKTTTIKTWQEWIPQEVAPIKWDEPITCRWVTELHDGTVMDLEVIFLSVDRPKDVKKLKSLDLTGLWLNEAALLEKIVLDDGTARVGRYPAKKDGAAFTWAGVMMDTNSMDDDHWWHDLAEGVTDPDRQAEIDATIEGLRAALERLGMDRPLMEFFEQPPALIEAQGSYVLNPEAENVKNQPMGGAYWLMLASGKPKEWIEMYLLNRYGKVIDGKPVYPEYNEAIHGRLMHLRPIPGLPITVGLDFGLSPAAACVQVSPKSQMLLLGECVSLERSMGLTQFIGDALKPYLANRFGALDPNGRPWEFRMVGDPAGAQRSQNDERTAFQIAADLNFPIAPAKTNAFLARRDAIAWFLNRLVEGQPAILIDESCRMIKKGLKGGYHYRRVQVSGEARFQDNPYKNKYSHPVEAAQYAVLDYVTIEAPASGFKMVPDWQRRIAAKLGAEGRPWKTRGGYFGKRTA